MSERERIDLPDERRYVRRNDQGEFTDDLVDVGRSLEQDRRKGAEHETREGQGDRGDRRVSRGAGQRNVRDRPGSTKEAFRKTHCERVSTQSRGKLPHE